MTVPVCSHIKPSGQRCGSPAMRGQAYCFYHCGLRECLPPDRGLLAEPGSEVSKAAAMGKIPLAFFGDAAAIQTPTPPMPKIPMPIFEDAAAVQIGYMQVMWAITQHKLDLKEARLMLSALNGARRNLRQMEECLRTAAMVATAPQDKKQPVSAKSQPATTGKRPRATGKSQQKGSVAC